MKLKEIPITTPADYFSTIDNAIYVFANGATLFSQVEAINVVFNAAKEITSKKYHDEFAKVVSRILDPMLAKNYHDDIEILEWMNTYSSTASYFKDTFAALQSMKENRDRGLEDFIREHEQLHRLRDHAYSKALFLIKYPFWRVFKEAREVNDLNPLFCPLTPN